MDEGSCTKQSDHTLATRRSVRAAAIPVAEPCREDPPLAWRPPAWVHGPPQVPRRAITHLCRDCLKRTHTLGLRPSTLYL